MGEDKQKPPNHINKDGQVMGNLFEVIKMVADNPRLSVISEDGMIKVSSLECPPNQKIHSTKKSVGNKYRKKPWLYFWHPASGLYGGLIFSALIGVLIFIAYIIKT